MQLPSFVRAVLIELPSQRLSTTIYDSKRGRPVFEPCLGQAASKGHVTARSMSMHLLRFPMPYANLQLESFSESTKKLLLLDWHKMPQMDERRMQLPSFRVTVRTVLIELSY